MRREIASQMSQTKKSAAPAARAFMEAQAQAEAEEAPELELKTQAVAAPDASYAWEGATDDRSDGYGGGAGFAEVAASLESRDEEGSYSHPAEPMPAPSLAAYPPAPAPMPPGMPPPPPAPARMRSGPAQYVGSAGPPGALAGSLARRPVALQPASKKKAPSLMSLPAYEKTSEELQLEATGAKVVETGFWIWRNVIVPPNVYVVHTRRGRAEPVTTGMGKSFRYNPLTDSYLVVPAAMQTIGIFARCISAEKQGVNVLAYVQWLISDFSLAYKRLDFSNINDPMGIVNTQLKEQAEAAIKDTVSTMSVEQVLKDKAPIIQELTERMKAVAEGRDGDGLGLKIVTVQIKEAMVASSALWDNLQAPFRHEKSRVAKLSEIETDAEIHRRSREAALEREAADAKAASEIAKLRAKVELDNREASLASQVKQQELAQKAEQDEQRYRQETDLQRITLEQALEVERQKSELTRLQAEHTRGAEQARLEAEEEVTRVRAAAARQAEESRLEAEQEVAQLRAAHTRAAEEARLAAENEANAIAQQEKLAIARSAAELAELEAKVRVAEAQRSADATDLRARLLIDRERHQAKLDAERLAETQRIQLVAAATDAELARERGLAEVARHRQETANAKSPAAVQGELVRMLPEIAQHMPDIQEYKYLGLGGADDQGAFDALPAFMAKALGVASAFGWKLPQPGDAPPPAPPGV